MLMKIKSLIKLTLKHMQKITPFLWFDKEAEEAVEFYTSVFKNSEKGKITRYTEEGREIHGMPAGTVMTVDFRIEGQNFTALNGGSTFGFTEAVSFVINCESQDEVDYYWEKLSRGGDPKAQVCGWLKDKYGVSWQVVPVVLSELLNGVNSEEVMKELLKMKKIEIAKLKRASELKQK